jgi:UDP-2-acetamido-2,6-beta-L-arabino-hexul-4-ose reductase
MKLLITGANGFVGRNLRQHLTERDDVEVICMTRDDYPDSFDEKLTGVDYVIHLAGVNRPNDPAEFDDGNHHLTAALADALKRRVSAGHAPIKLAFASSIQATLDNAYGASKRSGEQVLLAAQAEGAITAHIFRLPNVFGKWCRPNYNSAVATFCYNIARDLPITLNDPAAALRLVYIDDLVAAMLAIADGAVPATGSDGFAVVLPEYHTTVGEVSDMLRTFRESRNTLVTEAVGCGLTRALYATYVSYLPCQSFAYTVPMHGDPRGVFVEMLKTHDSGQFSYFTAHPGITRGGHYHHSKTEKFLVIKGRARFRFRQMMTGEEYALDTSGERAEIVETVPGWTHDITNIGDDEMVVMLWANEIFDRENPDTYACPL